MGYRGFIRACVAQARAAERERIREHKRLERERILQAREEMIEAAEAAVESYVR